MKITHDPVKDTINAAKHGVSLALAAELEWESALTWPDARAVITASRASADWSRKVGGCISLRSWTGAIRAASSVCAKPMIER